MQGTDIIGINEEKLDKLILDIGDTADRINNKFNQLEKLIADSSEFFDCESGNLFRSSFKTTKNNFAIVNKNFLTISSDLVKAKMRLYSAQEEVKVKFAKGRDNVISKSIGRYHL